MSFEVREAKSSDCEVILSLIKELAIYEKYADKVNITEEVLRNDGFGEETFYHCFVADADVPLETDVCEEHVKKVIAYAIYYFTYSTWDGRMIFIEDIYVTPEHRGKGIGTALLKNIIEVAIGKNCKRIDLQVLNWNKPSIDFYKNIGYTDLTEKQGWHLFRMERESMEKFLEKK